MNHETSDSGSEVDSEFEGVSEVDGLMISKEEADKNYLLAGTSVDEPPDQINLAKYEHLLHDTVHAQIMEILEETKITFKLADFQLLSLHVLGNRSNLILISPTGSGKMLGKSNEK